MDKKKGVGRPDEPGLTPSEKSLEILIEDMDREQAVSFLREYYIGGLNLISDKHKDYISRRLKEIEGLTDKTS